MQTTIKTIRLGDLGTRHVWFTSTAQPAGCDLIADEGDELLLPGDGSFSGDGSDWWNLEGTVAMGKWTWNGEGKPKDERANTVTSLVAFTPGWTQLEKEVLGL